MTLEAGVTRVIVVRHGETLWNVEGRLQGQLDSELSPRGREQVRALGRRLAAFAPVALYTSDLGRALETARAVSAACGIPPVLDPALRERALGIFEGKTREELERLYPDLWQRYRTADPDFVVPGGESARQRHDRTLAALRRHAERHPGACVVIVGHGGTLSTAFRACAGMPLEGPKTFSIHNAGLNRIDYYAGRFRLVTWGDVAHLTLR